MEKWAGHQMTERELSYRILYNIHIGGELSHIALKNALDECDNKGVELRKGFVTTLVNGVNERYLTLMYLISKQAGRPISKIKPPVRIMLAMGIYQAYYMSVPVSAACNEIVKLAGKCGFSGLKGFINGVLRGLLRSVENIDEFLDNELAGCGETERLSIKYSCPKWLVKHYINECGKENTLKLLEASCSKKVLTVYKLDSVSDEDFRAAFLKENIEKIPGINNAYKIAQAPELTSIEAYQKGYFIVQDISSMLATEILPDLKNADILDVCAAPGGKAIHCADRFNMLNCKVTARDLTSDKVRKIDEAIKRTGLNNIRAEVADALVRQEDDVESYDLVIADLPCSGLGVIGRKPDIKYKTKPEDIVSLAELQRNILANITSYVKQGGYLAYSTCTLAKQENEDNAEFIMGCGFEPVDIKSRLRKEYAKYLIGVNSVKLLPDESHDGFYIALFRKYALMEG